MRLGAECEAAGTLALMSLGSRGRVPEEHWYRNHTGDMHAGGCYGTGAARGAAGVPALLHGALLRRADAAHPAGHRGEVLRPPAVRRMLSTCCYTLCQFVSANQASRHSEEIYLLLKKCCV